MWSSPAFPSVVPHTVPLRLWLHPRSCPNPFRIMGNRLSPKIFISELGRHVLVVSGTLSVGGLGTGRRKW